jgi:hypothetical protein
LWRHSSFFAFTSIRRRQVPDPRHLAAGGIPPAGLLDRSGACYSSSRSSVFLALTRTSIHQKNTWDMRDVWAVMQETNT